MQENGVSCLIRLPTKKSLIISNCVLKYQTPGNFSREQFENVYLKSLKSV
jgi:hypothetical protein